MRNKREAVVGREACFNRSAERDSTSDRLLALYTKSDGTLSFLRNLKALLLQSGNPCWSRAGAARARRVLDLRLLYSVPGAAGDVTGGRL